MSNQPIRYRTAGGNVVVYKHATETTQNLWGSYECKGCHETRTGTYVPTDAQRHAADCKAC